MGKGRTKRRLAFVDYPRDHAKSLGRGNEKLAREAHGMRSALRELVEACEAGGTSRYTEALGRRVQAT